MVRRKRRILEPLGALKHQINNDRMALTGIALHLRDWHRTSGGNQDNVVRSVIEEIEDFNAERMKGIWDSVNRIIEEA